MNCRFTLQFAAIFAFVCYSNADQSFRIIHGRNAETLEFPYMAELAVENMHNCGGSIIHKYFILTAAHCIWMLQRMEPIPPNITRVIVGNDVSLIGGVEHEVQRIIIPPEYSDDSPIDHHDIALMLLKRPIQFNDRVQPVRLSKRTPRPNQMGWVTGFGKTSATKRTATQHLMAVELPVVSLQNCKKILNNVADDMICAGFPKGSKDACVGDSGGPYVIDQTQVGVVAWGKGCGREGIPGVYTNVALYADWIIRKVLENMPRH